MRKSTVAFEWQELNESQELPPLQQPDETPRKSRPWVERRLLLCGAVLLLVASLMAARWVMGQAQVERAQISHELALAVQTSAPTTSGAPGSPDLALTRLGHDAHEGIVSVEVQALGQGVAAVTVVTRRGSPHEYGLAASTETATVYRQLHFYRQTDDGWQPTDPIPDLWGQSQRLATAHFDFTYRSRDAQAVQAVAAELDALYAQIRRNLGLPPTPGWRIAIEVVTENLGDRPVYSRRDRIIVSSPALLAAPESFTDAVILRQSILLDLVDKAISEAVSTHWVPLRWYPMLSAMRLWQIWELGGPLAAGRDPVFRWLFVDIPTMSNETLPPLPAEYATLCALYSVWEILPIQSGIPLFCSEWDQAELLLVLSSDHHFTRFQNLVWLPSYRPYGSTSYEHGPQAYGQDRFDAVLTTALLDYAAAAFGRDRIPALWPALHEHQGWETLIPAVFGVSVTEFESGWQAYLAEIIGIGSE